MSANWLTKVTHGLGSRNHDPQQVNLGIAGTWFERIHPPGIQRNSDRPIEFTPTFHGRPTAVLQNPDR